jgi:hypothetical protein
VAIPLDTYQRLVSRLQRVNMRLPNRDIAWSLQILSRCAATDSSGSVEG